MESAASTSSAACTALDPQIAIAAVAILGAFTTATVTILRAVQDLRAGVHRRYTDKHPPAV